jgi:hypothetical protein
MTYEQLMELIDRYRGQPIETVRGTHFTASSYMGSPVFTPVSTGLGRSDGRKAAERFLERFNATGSLRPADYGDITRNASYFVGLIRHHRRSQKGSHLTS